jgi:hypothetical protein
MRGGVAPVAKVNAATTHALAGGSLR